MSYGIDPAKAESILELVREAGSIVITTHKSPDGDAMGSSLGLAHYLGRLGVKSTVIIPDEMPSFLEWMPGSGDVLVFSQQKEKAAQEIRKADLIFVLDYNRFYRTGEQMESALNSSKAKFVLIDHHHDPGDFAKIIYSDTSICSTSQMIYKLIQSNGDLDKLDIPTAECIYTGMVTDSGSFRFPSVTPETHLIAADLISRGMDHARIHREIYDSNIIDRIRLLGYALSEKLELIPGCATAFITLSTAELKKFNYRPGDTEGLVNQALSVQGIKLAAFFREGNNEIKVSFRSTGKFDVNSFARRSWNGGGHSNAAGGSTSEKMEVAVERFKSEVKQFCDVIVQS